MVFIKRAKIRPELAREPLPEPKRYEPPNDEISRDELIAAFDAIHAITTGAITMLFSRTISNSIPQAGFYEHFEHALRLNPRDPGPASLLGIGLGHFFVRRFKEARAMLLRSLQEQPAWVPPYRFLASCYAQMGRLDEG